MSQRRRVSWCAGTIAIVALFGCEPPKTASSPEIVRASDVESWAGAPLIDLETHAVFSIMPKEKRALSDGTEMWIFTSCPKTTTYTYGESAYARARCTGGEKGEECCHNQFVIGAGVIASYRPTGSCFTNCRARPSSRPCSSASELHDAPVAP